MDNWRDSAWPWIIIAIFAVIGIGGGIQVARIVSERTRKTLGFQQNNPGNIKRGEPWAGLSPYQPNTTYATFIAPEFGIRVIAYLMNKYASENGLRTVRGLISKYAPKHENPTDTYIANVAKAIGVLPDISFDVNARMHQLVKAIIAQEIGYGTVPYDDRVIDEGIAMARDGSRTARAVQTPGILPSTAAKYA